MCGSKLGGGGPLVVGMAWGIILRVRGVCGLGMRVVDIMFFLVVHC